VWPVRPILNHTEPGDAIYDPFFGSGTSAIAAELTERVCCGLEIDSKYVDVIVCRWQQLTGKPATLDGDGRSFDEIKAERLAYRKWRSRMVPSLQRIDEGPADATQHGSALCGANYRSHNWWLQVHPCRGAGYPSQ
jgi:hypothetical protein